MNILHLTLKKKWFDMIASGEKKEEYREIKPYWEKRFNPSYADWGLDKPTSTLYPPMKIRRDKGGAIWDVVQFKNGYSKNAPTIFMELKGIDTGFGKGAWGAEPNTQYFILKLGRNVTFQMRDD